MGTSWAVKLLRPDRLEEAAIRHAVETALGQVVREMSTWDPHSAISRYNRAEAGSLHDLPEQFRTVLACGLRIAAISAGAFDPTIAPVTDIWGFGPNGNPAEPTDLQQAEHARRRVGWARLQLERGSLLQPGDVALDLSGIAKGYAVDRVTEDLLRLGVGSLLVEIGGELRGHGVKPDLSPWWVALERPPGADALPETIVALHGLAVATSGDYRRFTTHGPDRFAHTMDPRTGRPVRNATASATVISRTCMEADAFATALLVLGAADGMKLAEQQDVAALMVERTEFGFREHASPALMRMAG